jgi:hypothetical protein
MNSKHLSMVLSAFLIFLSATFCPQQAFPQKKIPLRAAMLGTSHSQVERARFRVTLTGFVVNHQTSDNILQSDGAGDEVFVLVNFAEIWSSNRVFGALQNRMSVIYGDTSPHPTLGVLEHRGFRVQAGSASGTGGFQTGDNYPPPRGYTGTTPPGAPADVQARVLPMILWEGELRQGGPQANAAVIITTIWESDYSSDMLNNVWIRQVNNYLRHRATEGAQLTAFPVPRTARLPLVEQREPVLSFTPARNDFDRPIGIDGDTFNPLAASPAPATFTPAVMVLNLASAAAAAISTSNNRKGTPGVVEITYRDGQNYGQGSYTIFLRVDRL